MSAQATTESSSTVNQPIADARQNSLADLSPSGTVRKPGRRSPISGALLLLLLILASITGWQIAQRSTAAEGHPTQRWGYVLTLLGSPSKTYGPFADIDSCNFSLFAATANLDQRLPGLYIARPCAASSSLWLQPEHDAVSRMDS
jgi:hypothetical protein